MDIEFHGLPTAKVRDIRSRQRDAYGNRVEHHLSQGDAHPCRHCLSDTPAGQTYLILAHRPFETSNPYAETGPIFLCASDCAAPPLSDQVPAILRSQSYLLRGYCKDERIVYGSGQVVATPEIADQARALLHDPHIAFVDLRSASNTCFQCRIRRAS